MPNQRPTNHAPLIVIALLVAVIVWQQRVGPKPGPAPDAPPSEWAGLVEAFNGQRAPALQWAGMLHGLANAIEQDGATQQPIINDLFAATDLMQRATKAPVKPFWGGQEVNAHVIQRIREIGWDRPKIIATLRGAASALEAVR